VKKGDPLQAATDCRLMAAKQTAALIPSAILPLSSVDSSYSTTARIRDRMRARTTRRPRRRMEALTAWRRPPDGYDM